MTQFKVGDRVLVKDSTWIPNSRTLSMVGLECEVRMKSSVNRPVSVWNSDKSDWWNFRDTDLELVSTTPPATIQHEGYNYTRGEPVVPEWVKDGAWVVNIFSDELRQVKEVKPGVFDLVVNDLVSIRYQDAIRGQYRPFTNEDWKWGMWAAYKGEKVFVMSGVSRESIVEISCKVAKGVSGLSKWIVAHASELTPTTAP